MQRCNATSQISPQDHTDTICDGYNLLSKYNLLSEADIDRFIIKIDALNAHLDSLNGKFDYHEIEECCESDESSRDHIMLNNHRRVPDINLHLRYYRTIREFRLERASNSVPA